MAATTSPSVKPVTEDLNSNIRTPDIPLGLIEGVVNALETDAPVAISIFEQLEALVLETPPRPSPGRIVGTTEDDLLAGSNQSDQIFALAGDDIVIALGGDDRIFGGGGADLVIAGAGSDLVEGGSGDDQISGDLGNDNLNGDDGVDVIFGGDDNDLVNGGNGGDRIFGEVGNDILNGNAGGDFFNGGAGADIISGGSGNDRAFGGAEDDDVFGNSGNDALNGDAGNDLLSGGSGNDIVFGGTENDILTGGDNTDRLIGGAGSDSLSGDRGNDRLIGVDPFIPAFGFGLGEIDTLSGGVGRDTFVLGQGTEVFYDDGGNSDFALISDFELFNQDVIELPAFLEPPAPAVAEVFFDAGQLLPDAQVIPTGTPAITGNLSSGNDVDLFQITLAGGGTFSATTASNLDSQLFLFDENGLGVFANDDSESTLQATLPAGSPLTPLEAGTYFLAISDFNNDPVSSQGNIFGFSEDFSPLQIPIGPGGGLPLSGFTGSGFGIGGDYAIALTGIEGQAISPLSLGASPAGLPFGTGISFENDLIAIVEGVALSQLNLFGGSFNFV